MDARGGVSVVAALHRRGDVGAGEIHVQRAVQRRGKVVRGVGAQVGRVVVKEGKRAGQLGLLVNHLDKTDMTSPMDYKKEK